MNIRLSLQQYLTYFIAVFAISASISVVHANPSTHINKLLADDGFQTQHFGISVSVSEDTAVIEAFDSFYFSDRKSVMKLCMKII